MKLNQFLLTCPLHKILYEITKIVQNIYNKFTVLKLANLSMLQKIQSCDMFKPKCILKKTETLAFPFKAYFNKCCTRI